MFEGREKKGGMAAGEEGHGGARRARRNSEVME